MGAKINILRASCSNEQLVQRTVKLEIDDTKLQQQCMFRVAGGMGAEVECEPYKCPAAVLHKETSKHICSYTLANIRGFEDQFVIKTLD
jgi:hypothetical protein